MIAIGDVRRWPSGRMVTIAQIDNLRGEPYARCRLADGSIGEWIPVRYLAANSRPVSP